MLKIFVENQEIYIKDGTSVQLEVNNSLFSIGSSEGEVIFTFDIPAEINDVIFQHARFLYVQRKKKYNCRIEVSGHEIAHGDLYIQNSDKSSYSVGVVVNPFPDNFQSKNLNENDFGQKIVISQSVSDHNAKWKQFLKSTLDQDSNIKFPLFLDPSFYGNSNDDFGYYQMISNLNVTGDSKAILTDIKNDPDHKFVNRLFFDNSGNVIEEVANNKGIRIFNKQAANKMNSFTFCPAFRLIFILEKIFENAGYRLTGSFKTDPFAFANFVQSLRALDGNKLQYDVYKTFCQVLFNQEVIYSNSSFAHTIINNVDISMGFETGEGYYKTFSNSASSIAVSGFLNLKSYIPETVFSVDSENNIIHRLAFLIVNEDEPLPNGCYPNEDRGSYYPPINQNTTEFPTQKGGFIRIFGNGVVGHGFGYDGSDYYELRIPFNNGSVLQSGQIVQRKYKFILAKIGLLIDPNNTSQDYFEIVSWEKFTPNTNFETVFYNHNIFAKEFNIADFMPNLSNSDFINQVCNTFGLARYVDSNKREVEFSFIRDILKTKKVLDLSDYCISEFPKIGEDVEKQYLFSLGTETDVELPEGFIDPVELHSYLPSAKLHVGKYCYVREYNSTYQSVAYKDDNGVVLGYKWTRTSSNNLKLSVGSGDNTDIASSFKIPYQKAGVKTLNTPYFPVIDYTGYSPILHSENQPSEFPAFIFTHYGNERFFYSKNGSYVNKEKFRVICPDDAAAWGMDLTVNTDNSLGENIISPWLKFISNYETITHRFALPVAQFIQVLQTLKPQDKPIREQERFIMVNNIKLLPIKMRFQFKVNRDLIIAEIDCAKEKVIP